MFRRPRHAASIRSAIRHKAIVTEAKIWLLRRRGQDWLDRKINKPLKAGEIRIRSTETLKSNGLLWIVPKSSDPISFHTTIHKVSPEFLRLAYGPGTIRFSPLPIKRGRPFDWKLDAEEVA